MYQIYYTASPSGVIKAHPKNIMEILNMRQNEDFTIKYPLSTHAYVLSP